MLLVLLLLLLLLTGGGGGIGCIFDNGDVSPLADNGPDDTGEGADSSVGTGAAVVAVAGVVVAGVDRAKVIADERLVVLIGRVR